MRAPLLVAVALLAAGCAAPEAESPWPGSMAALGDSITMGVNVARDRVGENPGNSWAVGNDPHDGVESHYERILARNPSIEGQARDFARSGARMREMATQAQQAVDMKAEYVTVMFGANDACRSNVANMTPVETYRAQFRAGADVLRGLPDGAVVLVVSVPDVVSIYERYHEVRVVHETWQALRACPSVLSDRSNDTAREEARARIAAYNAVLAEESRLHGFVWDGGAVHSGRILDEDVGPVDYFHPSLHGQQSIANATWAVLPFADR